MNDHFGVRIAQERYPFIANLGFGEECKFFVKYIPIEE